MKYVSPAVFITAKTAPDPEGIRLWLREIGVSDAYELDARTNELMLILAGKRCYNSFELGLNPNVTKIRENGGEFIANLLKQGHGSVLEHVTVSIAFENISRVMTAELNRHRAGVAISEQSLRYVSFKEIPIVDVFTSERDSPQLAATREIVTDIVTQIEGAYAKLLDIWKMDTLSFDQKKMVTSMLRRILPLGLATGELWTANLRTLRHVCEVRCAPSAEIEICTVFTHLLMMLKQMYPEVFADFVPNEHGFYQPTYHKV